MQWLATVYTLCSLLEDGDLPAKHVAELYLWVNWQFYCACWSIYRECWSIYMTASSMLVYIHTMLVYIHDRQQYADLHTWPLAVCWSTYLTAGTMNGMTTSQFIRATLSNSRAWILAGQFCNVTLWPGPRSRGQETVSSATLHLQNSDISAAFCTVDQHYSYFPVWDIALY